MTKLTFGLVRQCNENAHDAWKSLIDKYGVSYEKQEILNEVTNTWNNCKIKNTSLYPDIWFNELYNLNLSFKKIKEKYEKDEYELNAYVFDVLPEEYNQVRVSCNVKIDNIHFKELKKEISCF